MAKSLKDVREFVKNGRMNDAARLLEKLASDPKADRKTLLAAADFFYRSMRDGPKAYQFVHRALRRRSDDAAAQVLAAEICLLSGQNRAAFQHADAAIALSSDDINVLIVNAAVRVAESMFDEAEEFTNKALAVEPDHLGAKYQLVRILIAQGRVEETLALIDTIMTAMPNAIEVLSIYVAAADMTKDDPVIARMRDDILPRFLRTQHPRTQQILYDLGKAHNAIGAYDASFDYFAQAKQLEPSKYSADNYTRYVDALTTRTSRADFFARGGREEAPILVVGMPRSGSTLLEQVLSGHADIGSAGESPSLRRIISSVGINARDGASLAKAIKEMPAEAAQRLGQRYLDETGHRDGVHIVDKSLHNFELLGFFAVMFPKAKILNIQRDPMDNCVACYLQKLPASHIYTETLDAMGHSYLEYRRLMAHWMTALPNPILPVRYEDMVTDLEGKAREIIDFLGLPWDPNCLDYQTNDNRVQTISVTQVRKPIYKSSMQRWRRYEKHLDPLKKRLLPLYPDGFEAPAR